MLSDEELKEIEHSEAEHQREHDAAGATLESCHTMGCHPQLGPIPVLLAEVKRLRDENARLSKEIQEWEEYA